MQYFNLHTIAYVREVASTLTHALWEWQDVYTVAGATPLRPAAGEASLRALATPLAGKAVLLVPILLSFAEAQTFAQWQGGTLICPSTAEEQHLLEHYLRERVTLEYLPYTYHLGLRYCAAERRIVWASGATYQWHLWQTPASRARFINAGAACLEFWTSTLMDGHWVASAATARGTSEAVEEMATALLHIVPSAEKGACHRGHAPFRLALVVVARFRKAKWSKVRNRP